MSSHPLVDVASGIILRAFTLQNENKLTESFVCYQEGIGILLKALKSITDSSQTNFREHLRQKVTEYMDRAEQLKGMIKRETAKGNYHEQIVINEGSTGYGYQRIFGRFLSDGTAREVWVDDPYIRSSFQQPQEQLEKFCAIQSDLKHHLILFDWTFSDTLHDREIRFDNGWVVKIGRGLDYIRRSPHKFCGLGVHDFDFRPCAATTVDIFHRSSLRVEM